MNYYEEEKKFRLLKYNNEIIMREFLFKKVNSIFLFKKVKKTEM